MNVRETADFDTDRSAALTCSPTGSRVRTSRLVLTPASICSNNQPRQRIPICEMRVRVERDLAAAVYGTSPRTLHSDPPAAEGDLARLMTVAHRGPVGIMLALRADDLVDLDLHQLMQHSQPDADAQRKQPVLRSIHELTKRCLHAPRQRELLDPHLPGARPVLRGRYGLHGGSSRLDGLIRTRHAEPVKPSETLWV